MKKIYGMKFIVKFILLLSLLMFSNSVLAANVAPNTELPVILTSKLYDGSVGSVRIDSFKITKVLDDGYYYNKKITVYYDIDLTILSGSNPQDHMEVSCYDESGNFLIQERLWAADHYIYVPRDTATLKIVARNPQPGSQEYLYRELTQVYAPDGRIAQVTKLQVPAYTSVGWIAPVTMYAPDENGNFSRTIEISPFEVEAYEAVGWYTIENITFINIKDLCKEYMAANDYNSVFDAVSVALYSLTGTKYEQELYKIRTEALNKWRKLCGKPIGLISYEVGQNSIGTPKVTLNFRNLSYQKVVAFKVKFDCYNVFGEREKSYYSVYYTDDANMDIADHGWYTWILYGADSVKTVKNIRVTEVVFGDGSKWYGK